MTPAVAFRGQVYPLSEDELKGFASRVSEAGLAATFSELNDALAGDRPATIPSVEETGVRNMLRAWRDDAGPHRFSATLATLLAALEQETN